MTMVGKTAVTVDGRTVTIDQIGAAGGIAYHVGNTCAQSNVNEFIEPYRSTIQAEIDQMRAQNIAGVVMTPSGPTITNQPGDTPTTAPTAPSTTVKGAEGVLHNDDYFTPAGGVPSNSIPQGNGVYYAVMTQRYYLSGDYHGTTYLMPTDGAWEVKHKLQDMDNGNGAELSSYVYDLLTGNVYTYQAGHRYWNSTYGGQAPDFAWPMPTIKSPDTDTPAPGYIMPGVKVDPGYNPPAPTQPSIGTDPSQTPPTGSKPVTTNPNLIGRLIKAARAFWSRVSALWH